MNKIFIYGFYPYKHYRRNITQQVIEQLPPSPMVVKKVFPVEFDREQFLQAVRELKPKIIIGLGQHSRSRVIRFERKAQNLYATRSSKPEKIDANGNKYLYTNLRLPILAAGVTSYNAGAYVCNYSMYVFCQYCKQHDCKFGFIHIPRGYDVRLAQAYLLEIIANVKKNL